MANIQSAPKSRLTNSELLTFSLLIINQISSTNFSVLKFKSHYNSFVGSHNDFNNSLNKITRTVYWSRAKELKVKIKNARSGLYNIVLGESKSLDPEIKECAQSVITVLKPYNKMGIMKYSDVIRYLGNLVVLCESDKVKPNLTKIGCDKRIEGLRKLYNEAIELEELLINDEGLNKRKRKSYITRRELILNYDKLVKRLNSLAEIEGDTEYLELFAWWNALIDRYRALVNMRQGANKVGKGDEGDNSQHDPSTGPDPDEGGGGEDDRPVIE